MKWQFSLNGWSDPLGIACLKLSLQNKDQIPMAEKHFRLSNTPETLSHSTRYIDVAQKMGFSADSHHNHIKKETNKNALWVQCCDCLPSQPVDIGGQNDRGTPQLSSVNLCSYCGIPSPKSRINSGSSGDYFAQGTNVSLGFIASTLGRVS